MTWSNKVKNIELWIHVVTLPRHFSSCWFSIKSCRWLVSAVIPLTRDWPLDAFIPTHGVYSESSGSPVFTPHSWLASDLQIPCLAKVALWGPRRPRVMERQRNSEGEAKRGECEVVKMRKDRWMNREKEIFRERNTEGGGRRRGDGPPSSHQVFTKSPLWRPPPQRFLSWMEWEAQALCGSLSLSYYGSTSAGGVWNKHEGEKGGGVWSLFLPVMHISLW